MRCYNNSNTFTSLNLTEENCGEISEIMIKCLTDLSKKYKYTTNSNQKINVGNNNNNNKGELILVTGSFFVMRDVRKLLGYEDFVDPF